MITIPASQSTTSPGASPAIRPGHGADRPPAIKPSAHVNSYDQPTGANVTGQALTARVAPFF
jgi:hypothetical protein